MVLGRKVAFCFRRADGSKRPAFGPATAVYGRESCKFLDLAGATYRALENAGLGPTAERTGAFGEWWRSQNWETVVCEMCDEWKGIIFVVDESGMLVCRASMSSRHLTTASCGQI